MLRLKDEPGKVAAGKVETSVANLLSCVITPQMSRAATRAFGCVVENKAYTGR
jgi:hypothetical protein